jgi:hypothetical protein
MAVKTLWMAGLVAIALVPLSGRPTPEARPLVFPITNAIGKSDSLIPLHENRHLHEIRHPAAAVIVIPNCDKSACELNMVRLPHSSTTYLSGLRAPPSMLCTGYGDTPDYGMSYGRMASR